MTRILLVEDNEMNLDMLQRRLVRAGYEVRTATDGMSGVHEAGACAPDLVLMDVGLPGIDGLEAIRRIRANPQTAGLRIIALTAHAMVEDRDKALGAGADDFDTKPVELPRLLAKIQALMAREAR